MTDETTLGARFASALARKDFDQIRGLLHPDVDFRGMTPNRFWEASNPDAVITDVLEEWLEPKDEVESFDSVETDTVGDRERTGYQFTVVNPDGRFVVEQQAYVTPRDGKIGWMRVMCTGFRTPN